VIDDNQARALAARWLQWAHSMPSESSPISDPDGQHAAVNQPDDVWFLAGTSGGSADRRAAVPVDRPLFFPLFNMWGRVEAADVVCPEATGEAQLNGEKLPTWTVHNTDQVKIPVVAGKRFPRVKVRMWGLWSYHPGLAAGGHLLEFQGAVRPGGFWVAVRYNLIAG
jgi:hypothetical protein